jgi:hypothetical protein
MAALDAARELGAREEKARILAILEEMIVAKRGEAIRPFNRHLPATHIMTGAAMALSELYGQIKREVTA